MYEVTCIKGINEVKHCCVRIFWGQAKGQQRMLHSKLHITNPDHSLFCVPGSHTL